MKKHLGKSAVFALGMLAAFTVSALAAPVSAAGGQLLYDRIGVSLFGEERYAAGDAFTGENGQALPASITYVDAAGGMTNYLPLRLIAELLNVRIEWDGEHNAVALEAPATGGVEVSQGDAFTETPAAAPVYGTVLGAFEEIDPTTVERDTETLVPTTYISGTHIQSERYGMPEYRKAFDSAKGDCILFTVTNNGALPQTVRVMRSTSPFSGNSRESFTSVQLEAGQTLCRAFRIAEAADPMQCELIFSVGAPNGGSYETDVTVSLEQFAAAPETEATVSLEQFTAAPETETAVAPRSTMSLSFSDLQPNEIALSSQFHSVSDHDALLEIISCTWALASQAVRIGWYNVDTGELYSVRYTGGSVQDERINSNTVPDGDYKICIKNVGTKAITGAMNYRVD